jgi:heptosyltransferase-2
MTEHSKILLVHTAFVGDVILTTPLIKALRQIYPESTIDVLVIPETAGILSNNPDINKIHAFDKRKNKFKSFFKTVFHLKREKYDLALLPHSSFTTGLLVLSAGIKRRIGFDRNFSRYFLTDKIKFRQNVHRTYKNLDLMKPLSNLEFSNQTALYPSAEDKEKINAILSRSNIEDSNLIAVSPGSMWETKKWPEDYYRELVQRLRTQGYQVVLIGAPNEKELCERVKDRSNSINAAGATNILESAALLEKCELLICNDSGAMHIANAMKTDVVAFFGPTVQSMGYAPIHENDKVMEVNLDCRPCSNHGSDDCPLGHHNCMKYVTVDLVEEFVKLKLGKSQ